MEEDIKILEDYIKLIKKGYCLDCNELCNIYTAPAFPSGVVALSLENLIKGYRELGRLYKSEKEMKIRYVGYYQDVLTKENVIPKSKIKEKIEELETKLKVFEKDIRYCKDRVQARLMNDEIYVLRRCMDLLKELMEE